VAVNHHVRGSSPCRGANKNKGSAPLLTLCFFIVEGKIFQRFPQILRVTLKMSSLRKQESRTKRNYWAPVLVPFRVLVPGRVLAGITDSELFDVPLKLNIIPPVPFSPHSFVEVPPSFILKLSSIVLSNFPFSIHTPALGPINAVIERQQGQQVTRIAIAR
jgi:hypothetical protein